VKFLKTIVKVSWSPSSLWDKPFKS